jgi:twitching motility protein PilT
VFVSLNEQRFSDLLLSRHRLAAKHDGRVFTLDNSVKDEAMTLFESVIGIYESEDRPEFTIEHNGQRYRAVVIESITGFSTVLRKINSKIHPWVSLGFPVYYLDHLINSPPDFNAISGGGLILIAGRPDSGKTTTSYSLLNEFLTRVPFACTTIEDPVETLLPDEYENGAMVTQRECKSVDFSGALRAALRSNQDLIFVGEIRDSYGASLALQGASTGHFVITTLHARNPTSAIERFIELACGENQSREVVTEIFAEVFRGCLWQNLEQRPGLEGRTLSASALFSSKSVISRLRGGNFQSLQGEVEIQRNKLDKGIGLWEQD